MKEICRKGIFQGKSKKLASSKLKCAILKIKLFFYSDLFVNHFQLFLIAAFGLGKWNSIYK
jgi:hypothetical protein